MLLKSLFLPFSGVRKQGSYLIPGDGARARYSLGTNVNALSFKHCQCPITLTSRICIRAQEWAPGLCVHTVFIRSEAFHCFVRRSKWRLTVPNGVTISSRFFENQPNEICSGLSEEASKCRFLKAEKLESHSNAGKGKEKKKER